MAVKAPRIRRIAREEWRLLRDVRHMALADAPYAFSDTLEKSLALPDETWRRRAAEGAEGSVAVTALAVDGDEPVGMATGLRDAKFPDSAFLVGMWVAPRLRGSGTAGDILDAVISWAGDSGASCVMLGVSSGNDRAAAFYLKHGFERLEGAAPDHPAVHTCGSVLVRRFGKP